MVRGLGAVHIWRYTVHKVMVLRCKALDFAEKQRERLDAAPLPFGFAFWVWL